MSKFREVTWEWATAPYDAASSLTPLGPHDNPEWRAAILDRLENTEKYPSVEGLIFFQDLEISPNPKPDCVQALEYGPHNTFKAEMLPDIATDYMKFRIGNVPSQFRYPQWYISRKAHLAKRPACEEKADGKS